MGTLLLRAEGPWQLGQSGAKMLTLQTCRPSLIHHRMGNLCLSSRGNYMGPDNKNSSWAWHSKLIPKTYMLVYPCTPYRCTNTQTDRQRHKHTQTNDTRPCKGPWENSSVLSTDSSLRPSGPRTVASWPALGQIGGPKDRINRKGHHSNIIAWYPIVW